MFLGLKIEYGVNKSFFFFFYGAAGEGGGYLFNSSLPLPPDSNREPLVSERKSLTTKLEKCGVFSDFQYGFRSSQSIADFLTVVSDRITRAFNRSGAT